MILVENLSPFSNTTEGAELLKAAQHKFSDSPEDFNVGMGGMGHYWPILFSYPD